MSAFLRFLAVLCAIAFVVAAVFVVFLHPIATRLPQPQFYQDALQQGGLYERLPALSGEIVVLALQEMKQAETDPAAGEIMPSLDAVRNLTPQDWEILLRPVLPPEYLKGEVDSIIGQFFALARGEEIGTARKTSLLEIKRRLVGPEMTEAYLRMLENKPTCTDEQWERSGGVPLDCRPTPEQTARALSAFGELTRTFADAMPDEIDPLESLRQVDMPADVAEQLEQWRRFVRIVEWLASWAFWVPVGLAALILLLAVRSMRGLFLWWGIPSLVAGFIGGLMALPFVSFGASVIGGMATAGLPPDVPVETVKAILGIVATIVNGITLPALYASGALFGGGAIALVLGLMMKTPVKPAAPSFR